MIRFKKYEMTNELDNIKISKKEKEKKKSGKPRRGKKIII